MLIAVAGAVGGTVSGTLKLRGLIRITQFRLLGAGVVVQPFISAAGALFTAFVLLGDVIRLPGVEQPNPSWAILAAYGFVAGFSEPFWLGVVRKMVSVASETMPTAARFRPAASANRLSSAWTPGIRFTARNSERRRSIRSTAATKKCPEPMARSTQRKSKKASLAPTSLPASTRAWRRAIRGSAIDADHPLAMTHLELGVERALSRLVDYSEHRRVVQGHAARPSRCGRLHCLW